MTCEPDDESAKETDLGISGIEGAESVAGDEHGRGEEAEKEHEAGVAGEPVKAVGMSCESFTRGDGRLDCERWRRRVRGGGDVMGGQDDFAGLRCHQLGRDRRAQAAAAT